MSKLLLTAIMGVHDFAVLVVCVSSRGYTVTIGLCEVGNRRASTSRATLAMGVGVSTGLSLGYYDLYRTGLLVLTYSY